VNVLVKANVAKGGYEVEGLVRDLLAFCKENKTRPDEASFTLLVGACFEQGKPKLALQVVEWMLRWNVSYLPVLNRFARGCLQLSPPQFKTANRALQIMEDCFEKGLIRKPFDEITCTTFLDAYAEVGDLQGINKMVNIFRSLHEKHTGSKWLFVEAYNSVLKCYQSNIAVAGDQTISNAYYEQACELYEEILRSRNLRSQADTVTFNTMLAMACSVGRLEDIPQYLKMMEKRRVNRSLVTFNILIKGTVESHAKFSTLIGIVTDMDNEGYNFDEYTYQELLSACIQHRKGAYAERLFKRLKHTLEENSRQGNEFWTDEG